MITSENVSDRRRRLSERLVVRKVILIHSVYYAPLTRLHTVSYIGERARNDDRHRIFDEGLPDLAVHRYIVDLLIFKPYVFLLFVHFF